MCVMMTEIWTIDGGQKDALSKEVQKNKIKFCLVRGKNIRRKNKI